MVGFELTESLAGRFRLAADGIERPMTLTIRGRSSSIASFLRHPGLFIVGEIDAPGFADRRAVIGSLDAPNLLVDPRITYAFTFSDNDRAMHTFAGEKRLIRGSLVESFTLLTGVIRDAREQTVADVLLRFDLRGDLGTFAKSLRITR
ncbi:MAG: hypothetical protein ABJE95_33375 [Byssovorax sp.]